MPSETTSRIILSSPTNGGHTPGALLTAAVLADWFDVPLTLVTDSVERQASLEALASTLGTATEATQCFESNFPKELMEFAHSNSPSLVVSDPSDLAIDIASRSTQPTLLVGSGRAPRLASGPLVLDGPVGAEDLETLALVAAWSSALDQAVQIVEQVGLVNETDVQADRHRLSELGVDIGVDRVQPHGDDAAIAVCRTRRALALVIPNRRLMHDPTVGLALEAGVNVLVSASPDPDRTLSLPLSDALSEPSPTRQAGSHSIERLDAIECMTYLKSRRVGRLGFVEGGWPIVLPINYRVTDDGEIVFKSVVGSKTVAADRSTMACFEVDDIDDADKPMWSVVAQGELGVVRDPRDLHTAWQNDPEPWIEGEEWAWLRLVPLSVSGRRITADPASGS